MIRKSTKSYAGRQVDLELLKHIETPSGKQRVDPDIVPSRIVSGIEKAVQRYASLFLTTIGSVKTDAAVGNTLLKNVSMGTISNMAVLNHEYAVANANTMNSIMADDLDTENFGDIPDDERIVRTELKDIDLKYDALTGGRVYVHVMLETASGDNYTFVIPVQSGV